MRKTLSKNRDIFSIAKEYINAKDKGYSVIIPHVCNNANTFNSNFSDEISYHYPTTQINYQLLGKKFLANNPGYVQFIDVDREPEYNRRLIVANMIVQNCLSGKSQKRSLNYAYLVKSMVEVKKYIMRNFNSENNVLICLPRHSFKASCGNWKFIEYLIEDIWENHKLIVI